MKKVLVAICFLLGLAFLVHAVHAIDIPIQIGKNGPVVFIPVGNDPSVSNPDSGFPGGRVLIEGTVVSISGDNIVVRDFDGKDHSIFLTHQTVVSGNLAIESRVFVEGSSFNGLVTAERIEADNSFGRIERRNRNRDLSDSRESYDRENHFRQFDPGKHHDENEDENEDEDEGNDD